MAGPDHPLPIDSLIVKELVRLLREIRVANGYFTDAGEYVIDEEADASIPDRATVIEILDDTEETPFQTCKRRSGVLQFKVIVNFAQGAVTAAMRHNARLILADIRYALSRTEAHQFPTGTTSLELGGRTMFEREQGSLYFRPQLNGRVAFFENHRSKS